MSLINSSSMASLWTMINQVQLYFLLLLTRASIPYDVQNAIIGAKFALNIAQYSFISSIGLFGSTIGYFDFDLSDNTLNLLSINSDSSIFNISTIIILIMIMIPFHLLIILFYKLVFTGEPKGKCKCIKIWTRKLIDKLFFILTFGWYIRFILETNQYVLISSIYEIYKFNISDYKRIISFSFAIFMLYLCFGGFIFVSCISLSSYDVSKENHSKLGEIFSGLKMQKKRKFYISVLLFRRAIFVVLLIVLTSVQSWILISMLSLIELGYLTYIIIIRPFESKKDNVIEITNELFFLLLLSSLIYLNSEENWSESIIEIYMWTIASNSCLTFSIILVKSFLSLLSIAKNGCPKSEDENLKVVPVSRKHFTPNTPVQNASSLNMCDFRSKVNKESENRRINKYVAKERTRHSIRIIDLN